MYSLKKLQPIKLDDLIRIGNNCDGGYVLSQKNIDNTKILLSFGINDDWSFEKDFIGKNSAAVYAYDYSIKTRYCSNEILQQYYASIIGYFFLLKRSKLLENYRNLVEFKKLYSDFHSFFKKNNKHYFIPKYIGMHNDEQTINFDRIFMELGVIENNSIFVKLDIESNEFVVLPELKKYHSKINGLVVEFHWLDIIGNSEEFENLITDLKTNFYIAHTHANNCGTINKKTKKPNTLEITFINKTLVGNKHELSDLKYPVKNLDFPNAIGVEDYVLDFTK